MSVKTAVFKCFDGVYAGQSLRLEVDHPYTLRFTVKGRTGYYKACQNNPNTLIWIAG